MEENRRMKAVKSKEKAIDDSEEDSEKRVLMECWKEVSA